MSIKGQSKKNRSVNFKKYCRQFFNLISSKKQKITYKKDLSLQNLQFYKVSEIIINPVVIDEDVRKVIRDRIRKVCSQYESSQRLTAIALHLFDWSLQRGLELSDKSQLIPLAQTCTQMAIDCYHKKKIILNFTKTNPQWVSYLQNKVYILTKVQMNPITYNHIADEIQRIWILFCRQSKSIFQQSSNLKKSPYRWFFRRLYRTNLAGHLVNQLLIFALQFKEGLSQGLDKLVFNAFYIIFVVQFHKISNQVTHFHLFEYFMKESRLWTVWGTFGQFCRYNYYTLDSKLDENILFYLSEVYNSLIGDFDPVPFYHKYGVAYYDAFHLMWRREDRNGEKVLQTNFFVKSHKSYKKTAERFSDYSLEQMIQSYNSPQKPQKFQEFSEKEQRFQDSTTSFCYSDC